MNRSRAVALLGILLMSTWWVTVPGASQSVNALEQGSTAVVVDLQAGETVVETLDLEAGEGVLVGVECEGCIIALTHDGESTESSHVLNLISESGGHAEVHINATVSETVRYFIVVGPVENHPTLRPAPSAMAAPHTAGLCDTDRSCMDPERGSLNGVVPQEDAPDFLAMGALDGQDEFHVVDASQGDTLEWQWLMTTGPVDIEVYFQDSTSERLNEQRLSLAAAHVLPADEPPVSGYWTADADGRWVVRLTSPDAEVGWAAHVFRHAAQDPVDLTGRNLTMGSTVTGHDTATAFFDWTPNTKLTATHRFNNTHLRFDQLMNGVWVTGTTVNLSSGVVHAVYPYPGVTAGRLVVNGTAAFAVELLALSFADLDGLEAPAYRPSALDETNASWPVLNLTSTTRASLTLAVHDAADTYRLVVDGWEDSIHFLEFTLDGDVTGLEAQIWDIDQTTGEVLNTEITRPITDQLRIGLQVGRGTHYVQFRLQDANATITHLWGDDVDPLVYTVVPGYELMDEGEEPWFEPSDEAVRWGEIARWFMGALFLVPVVFVLVNLRRERRFAEELVEKRSRLTWYAERLNAGQSSAKASRKDLVRALSAVAQLPWEDGRKAWGTPVQTHTTDGLEIGIWKVDPRLAKIEQAWPLVVGVHVTGGDWNIAALRFDAPEGTGFEVVHVEPRFLYQGEEVFLDTLKEGHRVYVYVELQGPAGSVDVELNGRMEQVPFASRVPRTVLMEEE